MTSAYNPHAGSWMQSSSASCIEQEVIGWMCKQAGYPNTSGGIFVSGGSMANLTALTVARNVKLSEDKYVAQALNKPILVEGPAGVGIDK